jgi:hypothetical protein
VDHVVNAPDNGHREHEHDDKRQKNGERQRGKLRKPCLKRLLNRPDERHTEKCEGYGFKQWSRKVKRSGYQKDRKKKLDALTGFKSTRIWHGVVHRLPLI